jgi:hypothetical protein
MHRQRFNMRVYVITFTGGNAGRTIYVPTAGQLTESCFELLATGQRPQFTVRLWDADAPELDRLLRPELEHSLRAPSEHVAVRVILQQLLAEVLAEQDSRNRLHQANGQTPL